MASKKMGGLVSENTLYDFPMQRIILRAHNYIKPSDNVCHECRHFLPKFCMKLRCSVDRNGRCDEYERAFSG